MLTRQTGIAEVEWLSPSAIRISTVASTPIKHNPVLIAFDDNGRALRMRSKVASVEIDQSTERIQIAGTDAESITIDLITHTVFAGNQLHQGPDVFVLGEGDFGFDLRIPRSWIVNNPKGSLAASETFDIIIYTGNSPKEVLEHRRAVLNPDEVQFDPTRDLLSGQFSPSYRQTSEKVNSWARLSELIQRLNQWSLGAIQYPVVDIAAADLAPQEVKQRFLDLANVLPSLSRTTGSTRPDRAMRKALTPYFLTYFREAFDRGYPIIRPFLLQFPNDAGSPEHVQEFMLGDEFLIAPVLQAGNVRRITLPRGNWTDLRTNIEHKGNQTIQIDAPLGRVPMFARNGSLFPLATGNRVELHYIPNLGGEFFQWEPQIQAYSQYHAAPALDFIRVEIESKAARTYEWVIHHSKLPTVVEEESGPYRRVNSKSSLRPNTWWYDSRLSNLHFMVRANANSDRIANISF